MQRRALCAVTALVVFVLSGSIASAQNLLVNPGFEEPITFNGPPFVGFWEGFSGGGPNASASNSTASPRTGTMNLDLTIDNQDNSFAGVFQDGRKAPDPASLVTLAANLEVFSNTSTKRTRESSSSILRSSSQAAS